MEFTYYLYSIFGMVLTLMYTQRNAISTRMSSDFMRRSAAVALGPLISFGIGGSLHAYSLYSSDFECVFINQLNETVEIATQHSSSFEDFYAQSDYYQIAPHSTAYVTLQPRSKVIFGYTYRFALKWNDSLLLLPSDFSKESVKTFLITRNGIELASQELYREWAFKHDGQRIFFRNA